MRKKLLNIIVILTILGLTTGCWDMMEINERAFVMGLGIDQSDKKLDITYIIPNLPVITGQSSGGEISFTKKTEGDTLYQANKDFRKINSLQISFDHTKVLILGKSFLAKGDQLKKVLDYLDRSPDYSKSLLVIATDMQAAELLTEKPNSTQCITAYLSEFFESASVGGLSYDKTTLKDFITTMIDNNGNGELPIITFKKGEIGVNGCLFLKDYKTCCTFPDEQVDACSWLNGKGEGTVVNITFEDVEVPYAISEIQRGVSFKKTDTGLAIKIVVETEGDISEFELNENQTLDSNKKIIELEKEVKKTMEEKMYEIIRLAQADIGFDIFRLSDRMKIQEGKLWEEIKDNWDDYFKSATITVEVVPAVRRIGMAK